MAVRVRASQAVAGLGMRLALPRARVPRRPQLLRRVATTSTSSPPLAALRPDLRAYAEKVGPLYPGFRRADNFVDLGAFRQRYDRLVDGLHCRDVVCVVAGRVRSKRRASAKLQFYDIQTAEGRLQVVASLREHHVTGASYADVHAALRAGDVVQFVGHPARTKVGELSLYAHGAELLAPCLHDIPAELKDVGARTQHRHIDMLVNRDLHDAIVCRSKVLGHMRRFLEARRFVEVETPILGPGAGGASARPFETTSHALGQTLTLRVAPELFLKRLVVGGLDRVYEIGKQFRNEGVDKSHNPEFTTCEFYMAYADLDTLMTLTRTLLHGLVTELAGSSTLRLASGEAVDFSEFHVADFCPALETAMGRSLPDLTDEDAVRTLVAMCKDRGIATHEPCTVPVLLDRLAGHYLEPTFTNPTFLINHPLAMSPLAKANAPSDGQTRTSSRFELFVAGQEICNAYAELNDPAEQRERFQAQQQDRALGDTEAQLPDETYCGALEYGLPPTAGWGLGIDRLVMLLSGQTHIREVLAFPLTRPRGDPSEGSEP